MSVCLYRKVADFQSRVLPQATGDRADPARRLTLGLSARPSEEPSERFTQLNLGCSRLARVSEVSRLPADGTSDPRHHWQTWKQLASNPAWIELDLDLLESNRRSGVAMTRAGAIEDRRRPGDEVLPELGLVQIGADHEERKNRPVMGVLWHASVTPVDDPSDTGPAEA
jgi:hypothetical protein